MRRVHRGVGLEIIQGARGAPGPRPQRTPVIRLARLALVDQADDSLRETGAVISLNTRGVQECVAPTVGEQLLGCWWIAARGSAPAEHYHYRSSAGGVIR